MSFNLDSSSLIECGPHRTISRTVSWSASGIYLAYGSSDRVTRLVTIESTQAREVVVLTGHQGPVTHVRFHPSDRTLLCTSSTDHTVRLWDCRGGAQRDAGTIELGGGKVAMGIDWCKSNSNSASMSHALVVTERDSRVVVYDTRKLGSSSGGSGSGAKSNNNAVVSHVYEPQQKEQIENTIFGPGSGKHLIAASQFFDPDTTSDLSVWDWTKSDTLTSTTTTETYKNDELRFPAHTERIYAMALSPDGKRLATGGADAIVGLWDTNTMTMVHTISRRLKFIRSVAFSSDSQILAHSSEENDVELVNVNNGQVIGEVSLGARRGGADHIAWHPSYPMLACARADNSLSNNSPVVIAKLSLSTGGQ